MPPIKEGDICFCVVAGEYPIGFLFTSMHVKATFEEALAEAKSYSMNDRLNRSEYYIHEAAIVRDDRGDLCARLVKPLGRFGPTDEEWMEHCLSVSNG